MKKMKRTILFAAAASFGVAPPLSAQLWEAALPGDDFGSVALNFGIVSPTTTFPDDGSFFEEGAGIGASISYWPFRRVGLRTHVLRAKTPGNHGDLAPCPPTPCSAVGYQEPVVWLYGVEGVVRRPMGGDGFAWFPYASLGVVGKSYRWSVYPRRIGDSAAGWTAAAGLEVRSAAAGPLGFVAEVRNYRTFFRFLDKMDDQSDLAFTAGITLSR